MNEFFFKFRHGIKVYKNVLTDSERKMLVESSKKYLKKISPDHPGLQSVNYLDRLFKIETFFSGDCDAIDGVWNIISFTVPT